MILHIHSIKNEDYTVSVADSLILAKHNMVMVSFVHITDRDPMPTIHETRPNIAEDHHWISAKGIPLYVCVSNL